MDGELAQQAPCFAMVPVLAFFKQWTGERYKVTVQELGAAADDGSGAVAHYSIPTTGEQECWPLDLDAVHKLSEAELSKLLEMHKLLMLEKGMCKEDATLDECSRSKLFQGVVLEDKQEKLSTLHELLRRLLKEEVSDLECGMEGDWKCTPDQIKPVIRDALRLHLCHVPKFVVKNEETGEIEDCTSTTIGSQAGSLNTVFVRRQDADDAISSVDSVLTPAAHSKASQDMGSYTWKTLLSRELDEGVWYGVASFSWPSDSNRYGQVSMSIQGGRHIARADWPGQPVARIESIQLRVSKGGGDTCYAGPTGAEVQGEWDRGMQKLLLVSGRMTVSFTERDNARASRDAFLEEFDKIDADSDGGLVGISVRRVMKEFQDDSAYLVYDTANNYCFELFAWVEKSRTLPVDREHVCGTGGLGTAAPARGSAVAASTPNTPSGISNLPWRFGADTSPVEGSAVSNVLRTPGK